MESLAAALSGRFRVVAGPGWLLVHGDCLDVLPLLADRSVQVTLTDPPYEAEAHTLMRRQKGALHGLANVDEWRGVNASPLDFDAIAPDDRATAAAQIARVTAHRALAFCQAEAVAAWRDCFNAAGMPYRRSLPWVKPDAMPSLHGRYPGQAYESIVLAQYPSAPPCPMGGKAQAYTFTRARAGQAGGPGGTAAPHPTTKPLQLMLAMVEDFTDPGDLVCDPFAGSGTTGVACLRLGRRFLGIERDDAYFEIARRRLNGDEAKPRPEQPSLFSGVS